MKFEFNQYMDEGYGLYKAGKLSHLGWNAWSWYCYKFMDGEITLEELKEKLHD